MGLSQAQSLIRLCVSERWGMPAAGKLFMFQLLHVLPPIRAGSTPGSLCLKLDLMSAGHKVRHVKTPASFEVAQSGLVNGSPGVCKAWWPRPFVGLPCWQPRHRLCNSRWAHSPKLEPREGCKVLTVSFGQPKEFQLLTAGDPLHHDPLHDRSTFGRLFRLPRAGRAEGPWGSTHVLGDQGLKAEDFLLTGVCPIFSEC